MKIKVLIALVFAIIFSGSSWAQDEKPKKITISGTVFSEEGMPVSGASIYIDETETNSRTNSKGEFKLKIAAGSETIIALKPDVGIIGMTIGDSTEFHLVLNKQKFLYVMAADPNDEEVELGYRTVKKKYLTTPANTVNTTNPKYASYTSVYEMLKGEVPGVQVTGNSIVIRGVGSIMGGSQPLFVVDGMEVASLNQVVPANVQSIEVLKGAAASIYGSKGSNGVILVRTYNKK